MSEARIQLDAQVQVRRDIEANWAAVDPVLRDGEIAYSKDLNRIKVGDGARKWSELEYMAGSSASLSLDTEMSDTSENAVQNKVIKAYVDGKAAEAQAAAEQYIQNEVLTDYATTKYAEGLVNDLEKEIDGRGYLTSAAMNGYATKEDIKGFVTKGSTLDHYGITDAMQVIHYPYAVVTESNPNSVGYATWKTTGPYLRVGNQNNYLLINSEMKGGHPIIWAENVLNGVEQGWTRLVDTGYLGTLAIEVAPASPGNTRPTTSPTAFCTYAYSDNGWKTYGPALAFANGNYKALLNVGMYDPSTTDNGTTAYLGIVYGGVQSKWSLILTEHNIGDYAAAKATTLAGYGITDAMVVGGTVTDLNNETAPGAYTNSGGTTNSPSSGTFLTIRGANSYFISQIHIAYNSQMRVRAIVNSGESSWSDWRTLVDSENVKYYALSTEGGTISGALTISDNLTARLNILLSGALKMSDGNIEGVGAIIHKSAGAYNIDHYGNFYAASTATDSAYWNFKRADGTPSLYVYAGTGRVETAFDTNLGRYGGSTGCTVNMGNQWNRANTNVYGDFKVIGYPAEFQNGITLGGVTINSWDDIAGSGGGGNYLPLTGGTLTGALTINSSLSVSSSIFCYGNIKISAGGALQLGNEDALKDWDSLRIKVVERTETSGVSIAPNVLNRWTTPLTGTLTINFSAGRTGVANYYMMEFTTGATVPTITLPSGITWQGGDNILSRLEPNKTYQISILNNLAVGGAF